MKENLYQAEYNITKKEKIKKFYEKNKILIFSFLSIILICVFSIIYYQYNAEKKKIYLSDQYIQAKIYLENGNKIQSKKILESILLENDKTYSTLSLFLLLNENLITDEKDLLSHFDNVLSKIKYEDEIRNLIILKKAILLSNFENESELLKSTKNLINKDTIWKPHALMLLGDFFLSKKQYLKAKEFYMQILALKNISREFYVKTNSKIALIPNE
tara:strand:- start:4199 stop:4846 length:648 start_codon:yes stop_codon:yes gene_type:complete